MKGITPEKIRERFGSVAQFVRLLGRCSRTTFYQAINPDSKNYKYLKKLRRDIYNFWEESNEGK